MEDISKTSTEKRKDIKACKGCHLRRVKCDFVKTNPWPCGASIRLKLLCEPHEDESPAGSANVAPGDATENTISEALVTETLQQQADLQTHGIPPGPLPAALERPSDKFQVRSDLSHSVEMADTPTVVSSAGGSTLNQQSQKYIGEQWADDSPKYHIPGPHQYPEPGVRGPYQTSATSHSGQARPGIAPILPFASKI